MIPVDTSIGIRKTLNHGGHGGTEKRKDPDGVCREFCAARPPIIPGTRVLDEYTEPETSLF